MSTRLPSAALKAHRAASGDLAAINAATKQKKKDDNNAAGGQMDDEPVDCYGLLETSIVGIQHYRGIISRRELMTLQRRPTNQYDRNAIEVRNSINQLVGHLPREVVAVLAPLLDKAVIEIDAKTTSSVSGTYKVPILLEVFIAVSQKDSVGKLLQSRLGWLKWNMNAASDAPLAESGTRAEDAKKYEEKLEDVFSRMGFSDAMALAPAECGPDFVGALLPFQAKGLTWMLQREKANKIDFDAPPPTKSDSTVSSKSQGKPTRRRTRNGVDALTAIDERIVGTYFWERGKDKNGRETFTNVITKFSTTEHPTIPRGGVLADEMGLGKSVQLLGLMSHPVPGAPGAGTKTLIICPLTLLQHWADHAKQFLPSRRVTIHHGASRTLDAVKAADIVISTYGTVRTELADETTMAATPLGSTVWARVVLDEAHTIKDARSKTAEACSRLQAQVRWAATGTPLQNRITELQALIQFLRLAPFGVPEVWKAVIRRPMMARDPTGLDRLRQVLRTYCLRRTKAMQFEGRPLVDLPPLQREVVKVPMDATERAAYDNIKKLLRAEFEKLEKAAAQNTDGEATTTPKSAALVLLLRLRQACDDTALVPESLIRGRMAAAAAALTADDIATLLAAGDETCAICLSAVTEAAMTECRHVFCEPCLQQLKEASTQPSCPLCRASPLKIKGTHRDAAASSAEGNDAAPPADKSVPMSSKTKKLLAVVRERIERGEKVTVFSQWVSMLRRIGTALDAAGLKYSLLEGSMSPKAREASINAFKATDASAPQVMLLSTMAGGTGLNLTCASVCVLFDPWWNPAIDKQAYMRVHRIGQTRPVTVLQLAADKSADEQVLELQRKKQALFDETFDFAARGAASGSLTLNELRSFFV